MNPPDHKQFAFSVDFTYMLDVVLKCILFQAIICFNVFTCLCASNFHIYIPLLDFIVFYLFVLVFNIWNLGYICYWGKGKYRVLQ